MRWLGKLLSSKKCSNCGRKVIKQQELGRMLLRGKGDMAASQLGLYCVACGKIICGYCSSIAAKEVGASYFLCPFCGKDIHESSRLV